MTLDEARQAYNENFERLFDPVSPPDIGTAHSHLHASAADLIAAQQAALAERDARVMELEAEREVYERESRGHGEQFLAMRQELSAAGVDHIGKSVAESIGLLAKERDGIQETLEVLWELTGKGKHLD